MRRIKTYTEIGSIPVEKSDILIDSKILTLGFGVLTDFRLLGFLI